MSSDEVFFSNHTLDSCLKYLFQAYFQLMDKVITRLCTLCFTIIGSRRSTTTNELIRNMISDLCFWQGFSVTNNPDGKIY
jgi:hypothetical protein